MLFCLILNFKILRSNLCVNGHMGTQTFSCKRMISVEEAVVEKKTYLVKICKCTE